VLRIALLWGTMTALNAAFLLARILKYSSGSASSPDRWRVDIQSAAQWPGSLHKATRFSVIADTGGDNGADPSEVDARIS
jgi:hypothetical protein